MICMIYIEIILDDFDLHRASSQSHFKNKFSLKSLIELEFICHMFYIFYISNNVFLHCVFFFKIFAFPHNCISIQILLKSSKGSIIFYFHTILTPSAYCYRKFLQYIELKLEYVLKSKRTLYFDTIVHQPYTYFMHLIVSYLWFLTRYSWKIISVKVKYFEVKFTIYIISFPVGTSWPLPFWKFWTNKN